MARLRRRFNVAVAEVDAQDVWQRAVVGVVSVSANAAYLHGLLESSVKWIENERLDIEVVDYCIEIL